MMINRDSYFAGSGFFCIIGFMEAQILLFIQENIRCVFLDWIFVPVTHLGDGGAVWLATAIILLIFKKTRRTGLVCATALLLMLILNNLCIKNLVARIRPYEVVDGLVLIVAKAHDLSFPSGHTAASFAFATGAFLCAPKKLWIPSLILAVLISVSRLYVGIHWPTDVLGGMVTGIFCGAASFFIWRKISDRNQSL